MSVTVRDLNIAIGGAPIVRGVDLDIADAQRVGWWGIGLRQVDDFQGDARPAADACVVSGSVVMGGMETVGTDDRRLATSVAVTPAWCSRIRPHPSIR